MSDSEGRWGWHEVMSSDMTKAEASSKDLFDWTGQAIDVGEASPYTTEKGSSVVGGWAAQDMVRAKSEDAPDAPSHWMNYLPVPEVDVRQAKAEELGANILKGDTEIPDMGHFALVQDPAGRVFGLWKHTATPQT